MFNCHICEDRLWEIDQSTNKSVPCECYYCDLGEKHNPKNKSCRVNMSHIQRENPNQAWNKVTLQTFKPRGIKQSNSRDNAQSFVRGEIKDLCISGSYQTGKTTILNAIRNSCFDKTNNRGIELIDTYELSTKLNWNGKAGENMSDVEDRLYYLKKIPILLFELPNRPSIYTQRVKDAISDLICSRIDDELQTAITITPNVYQMKQYSLEVDKRLENYFTIVEMDT